jgi:hypothetical protein
VKARGKKRRTVFFLPRLSESLMSFSPSAFLVFKVKSGAVVPVDNAIVEFLGGGV